MRGTPKNTLATFPARKFSFIFDPLYLPTPDQVASKSVFDLIHDLRFVEPRVDIHVLLPCPAAIKERQLVGLVDSRHALTFNHASASASLKSAASAINLGSVLSANSICFLRTAR